MEDEHVDLVILFSVSILAVAAYFVFNFSVRVFGVLVFLDLLTVLVLYCGAAMVTKPEHQVRERERIAPPGPVGWLDDRFDAETRISLPVFPSVYPKNLRFVAPQLFLMSIPVIGGGGALTIKGWGFGRRSGGDITELFGQFAMFDQPLVAGIGALVVLAQVGRFYRCHVTTGRYEQWTTHMMLEVQGNYVLWYVLMIILFVLYAILILVVVGIGVAPVIGDSTAQTVWLLIVVITGLALKLAFEWSRVRGERQLDIGTDSFTANFRPTPPDQADQVH